MKDATGELSMTAVAVVAIAAISVLFSQVIWPMIKTNIINQSKCTAAYACECNGGNTCECVYLNDSGGEDKVTCPRSSVKDDVGGGKGTGTGTTAAPK